MTATLERLHREQEFHDRQARARRQSWANDARQLVFDENWYLDHEPWIRPALNWLRDVQGEPVLDLGCGHGMASIVLARRGAVMTGVDLSGEYVLEARARAEVNDVAVRWIQADAEHLPFADGSFARVWGNAVLHHLDLQRAASEIRRVLRPGGWAVFCEPWGENPLLEWARRRLGKQHTADERALRRRDLDVFARTFSTIEVRPCQVFGMAGRFLGKGRLRRALDWCDDRWLHRVSLAERFCRYVVLRLAV